MVSRSLAVGECGECSCAVEEGTRPEVRKAPWSLITMPTAGGRPSKGGSEWRSVRMKKAGKTKGMAKWMETGQMRGSLKSQKGFRTTKVRGPFGNLARDEAERHKKGQMMQSHSPQLRSTLSLGETSLLSVQEVWTILSYCSYLMELQLLTVLSSALTPLKMRTRGQRQGGAMSFLFFQNMEEFMTHNKCSLSVCSIEWHPS